MILYSPSGEPIEVDPDQEEILLNNGYSKEMPKKADEKKPAPTAPVRKPQ